MSKFLKVVSENSATIWLTGAVRSYVDTMRELAENTVSDLRRERPEPTFYDILANSPSTTLILTAIFSLFGLLIAYMVLKIVYVVVVWVLYGSNRGAVRVIEAQQFPRGADGVRHGGSPPKHRTVMPFFNAPPESTRWFNQAWSDMTAALNDYESETPAPEWVCYKCHQAFEKGLKAIIISQTSSPINQTSHDLCDLAAETRDPDLEALAERVQGITGPTPRMRYPDFLPFPRVPMDVYTMQDARTVHDLTEQALSRVKQILRR